MRILFVFLAALLAYGCASSSPDTLDPMAGPSQLAPGELEVEILSPTDAIYATDDQVMVEVEGAASSIGGVRFIDMVLVLDTSMSLKSTDPDDYRSAGATEFVNNLSAKSDIQLGVVTFDNKSSLKQSLTTDRAAVIDAIQDTKRAGGTNIAAGIVTALQELQTNGRLESSRVIMLFTDGKSNQSKVREATRLAQGFGVTIQTILLGDSERGAAIMQEVAQGTGGTFVQITDPSELPAAFMNMRTTGVDSVTLSVNGGAPMPTRLTGGTFSAALPLEVGENRIEAFATSLDDQTRSTSMTVHVHDASCATLEVAATRNGRPAMSLNERAVEIVMDASRSMWGQIDGKAKMNIAQQTLLDAADWLPHDLDVALRAYGNQSPSDANDCNDSSLLVPFGTESRDPVKSSIETLRPKGQTPIAYALEQAEQDFGATDRERSIVLVTDGIESCNGNPVEVAAALASRGITTHVIGFGMAQSADEDTASLQTIAQAGGGQFVAANNASELKSALEDTVGTPYRVFQGEREVAKSRLGNTKPIFLSRGNYRLRLESVPPREIEVAVEPRDEVTLTLANNDGEFAHRVARDEMPPMSCETAMALAGVNQNDLASTNFTR